MANMQTKQKIIKTEIIVKTLIKSNNVDGKGSIPYLKLSFDLQRLRAIPRKLCKTCGACGICEMARILFFNQEGSLTMFQ